MVAPDASGSGTKFGLLVVPMEGDHDAEGLLHLGRTWRGDATALIPESDRAFWTQALGSLAWQELTGTHRLVLMHGPSSEPEVVGREDDDFLHNLGLAWQALLLARHDLPLPQGGSCFTGTADVSDSSVRLRRVRLHAATAPSVRPLYATRPSFHAASRPWTPTSRWVADWLAVYESLRTTWGIQDRLIRIAMHAFVSAVGHPFVEFRIPDFVRATDCLIATAKGQGKIKFVERARLLAPGLANHWFLRDRPIVDRLGSLYDRRSDAVHGRLPFEALMAQGEEGADEVARLEFLAESVAREAIRWALGASKTHPIFDDRGQLESAWEAGSLPSYPVPTGDLR